MRLADTGAARTLITPDVALELDLDMQTPVRQERIALVHRVVSAPVVSLASVQIGAQRLTNVEALVLPLVLCQEGLPRLSQRFAADQRRDRLHLNYCNTKLTRVSNLAYRVA